MSLIERARRAMNLPLPGFSAQAKMMPPGRMMPADTSDAHIGGVLLLAYPYNGQDRIVLTRRTNALGRHGGQISFPAGGAILATPIWLRPRFEKRAKSLGSRWRMLRSLAR